MLRPLIFKMRLIMVPYLQPQTLRDFPLHIKCMLPAWPSRPCAVWLLSLLLHLSPPPLHAPFSSHNAFLWLQADFILGRLICWASQVLSFYKQKARPSTCKRLTNSLCHNTGFIMVIWNRTCNIAEICLYLNNAHSFVLLEPFSRLTPAIWLPVTKNHQN